MRTAHITTDSPAEFVLGFLELAHDRFKEQYPAPYAWPSEAGRINQLLVDAINTATIIMEKEGLTKTEK